LFRSRRSRSLAALLALVLAPTLASADAKGDEVVHRLPQLLSPEHRDDVLKLVRKRWQPELVPMVLDLIPLSRDGAWNRELIGLLEEKTGEKLGYDVEQWYAWLWAREPRLHPLYPELKAAVCGLLDPKFRGYFSKERTTLIRLDEVRWGGVRQDGIPPLRSPSMIPAAGSEGGLPRVLRHRRADVRRRADRPLTEDELRAADGRTLPRLPSHRAFWFGWHAAYTHTRLVD